MKKLALLVFASILSCCIVIHAVAGNPVKIKIVNATQNTLNIKLNSAQCIFLPAKLSDLPLNLGQWTDINPGINNYRTLTFQDNDHISFGGGCFTDHSKIFGTFQQVAENVGIVVYDFFYTSASNCYDATNNHCACPGGGLTDATNCVGVIPNSKGNTLIPIALSGKMDPEGYSYKITLGSDK